MEDRDEEINRSQEGVWDRGKDEDRQDLEGIWDTGEEFKDFLQQDGKRKPRWQKDFTEYDYYQFLLLAKQRVNKEELDITLGNIQDRLLAAQHENVLPAPDAPTYVARDEFINVPQADLLVGRINAVRGMVEKHGRKKDDTHVLKYRTTIFESMDEKDLAGNGEEKPVFSVTTKFPDAMVGIKMLNNQKFAVNVDFKQQKGEEEIPGYRSGFLPADRLTREEVQVLARSAIEVGFYNIYGDPNLSPYPWENELPEKPPEPPPSTQSP